MDCPAWPERELLMFENPFESKSYLVIDDFGDMRTVVKGLLRSLGASEIEAVRNGKEAVDQMARRQYDVVLCDYNLGKGKDGQQVLEEARSRQLINIATVFVMITAENTREMVMGAVEYEPDSYLSKPFTKELLRSRLEKLFQRKADLGPVNSALEKKNYAKAIELLDQRLEQKPKNTGELIKLKSEVYFQSGNYDAALQIYDRLLAVRDIPWARLGLGKVQYLKKQFVDAKETFEQLLSSNRALISGYDWLAKTQRALGFADDAQATLSKALALSPKAILRQQALGELAMENKAFDVAEQAFGKAVKLGDNSVYNHPAMYSGLARSKSALGNHDDALQVVGRINAEFSDESAEFYAAAAEAVVRQEQGDNERAKAALQQAETIHHRHADILSPRAGLELAKSAMSLGEKEQAEAILATVVHNNHDDDEFLVEVTGACREVGISDDPEGLVRSLRQHVVEMNNKGVKLIKVGRFSEAITLLCEAAEGMSGNKVINLNTARACVMKMEKDGVENETIGLARKHLERVKKLDPDDNRLKDVMRRFHTLVSA